jgi:hypothetical protein
MVFYCHDALNVRSGIVIICIGGTAAKVVLSDIFRTKMAHSRSPGIKRRGSNAFRSLRSSRDIGAFVLSQAANIFRSCAFSNISPAFFG